MKEEKPQRVRRTHNELKTDVLNAVSLLSKEKQLSLITMVDVGKRSGIRVDVLQRSYGTIEKVLSLYAASVDYWISDLFDLKHPLDCTNEENMREAFANLINALYNDSEMQRLLVWELSEDNPTTRRLATSRDTLEQRNQIQETARKLKQRGVAADVIAECTGLTEEEVKAL